jgi:uncharacterized protein
MASPVPEKVVNFNMYADGNKLVGITGEVKLPPLESLTETISGAGIAGEFESATPGHYKSMQIEIPFRTINDQPFILAALDLSIITLRGSQQYYDSSTGYPVFRPLKIALSGILKNMDLGTIGAAKPTETNIILEVLTLAITENNVSLLVYDKLNFICIMNGVDQLAQIRSQI